MISLRVKLLAYFMVLSLLPLAAGYWGFASAAKANETSRVDERLQVSLHASLAAFADELTAAQAGAKRLARDPALQQALAGRDRAAIARLLRPGSRVILLDGEAIGRVLRGADARVRVTADGGTLGWVVRTVPFDDALARRLQARSGLGPTGRIALLDGDRVIGVKATRAELLAGVGGGAMSVNVAGEPQRALLATKLAGQPELSLVTLASRAGVAPSRSFASDELLLGVAGSLLLIALVAYVEGISITRTLRRFINAANAIADGRLGERVPVRSRDEFGRLGHAFNEMAGQLELERLRLRTITVRFGEALAATHDLDQLLRVTVETAVEATGATGGAILRGGAELVRVGDLDESDRISLPLEAGGESFGLLVLGAPTFPRSAREVAASLVAHAAVALQNARLYEIVERQALVDSLTGLPNRRQCETALEDELARSRRSGAPFAFVLADLDDFKAVNDTHGHLAGDRVLREFGTLVRESVRDMDLAARWGGEEFALLFPGADLAAAEQLVERIRTALTTAQILLEDGTPVLVTASFGVAAFPHEASIAMLVRAADAALYEAKRTGKNRITSAAALAPAA